MSWALSSVATHLCSPVHGVGQRVLRRPQSLAVDPVVELQQKSHVNSDAASSFWTHDDIVPLITASASPPPPPPPPETYPALCGVVLVVELSPRVVTDHPPGAARSRVVSHAPSERPRRWQWHASPRRWQWHTCSRQRTAAVARRRPLMKPPLGRTSTDAARTARPTGGVASAAQSAVIYASALARTTQTPERGSR